MSTSVDKKKVFSFSSLKCRLWVVCVRDRTYRSPAPFLCDSVFSSFFFHPLRTEEKIELRCRGCNEICESLCISLCTTLIVIKRDTWPSAWCSSSPPAPRVGRQSKRLVRALFAFYINLHFHRHALVCQDDDEQYFYKRRSKQDECRCLVERRVHTEER